MVVEVPARYDTDWGYSARLVDFADYPSECL
jgi:hypothetical protein